LWSLALFCAISKTLSFLDVFESLQTDPVSGAEQEMNTILSEMEKLLFVPPRLCNFEIIYRALIIRQKTGWD
jgi:hypothetical protein